MAGGREWKESAKAGGGALLGLAFGTLGKIVCCVVMIGVFCFSFVMNELEQKPQSVPPGTSVAVIEFEGGSFK